MARTRCILCLLYLFVFVNAFEEVNNIDDGSIYHNEFAVHIPAGDETANALASKYGYENTGQIGSLENYYLFRHHKIRKRSVTPSHDHHERLSTDPHVAWVEQQVEKRRVKRDNFDSPLDGFEGQHFPHKSNQHSTRSRRQFFQNPFSNSFGRFSFFNAPLARIQPTRRGSGFPDPLYEHQWYLSNGASGGFDMNVTGAWNRGYTGKGVVISILDDGIQHNHPDLAQNYDPKASTDINDSDPDPMPRDNGDNKHGTRCAGEVASVAFNDYCGVGVAYNASVGGVRMLDGTVNDAVEARAISLNPEHIDIYSASWGPEDDGKTVDGPGPLARRAFINGVIRGRHGKGSIFVWASGNGGRHTDNCNCDGYTNSIFTLSISSASQRGLKPWYLEECSSTLASTYSSGTPGIDHSVATADMDGNLRPDRICTLDHTGTSASAPLAAGLCALVLEANPDLTWRDMQHIVVRTSRHEPLKEESGWFVNAVQRHVSHKFGYGLMDAGAMVALAEKWRTVPPQHICRTVINRAELTLPTIRGSEVRTEIETDGCAGTSGEVRYLEHVQAKVSLRFLPRGNINIKLISPSGTSSILLFGRPRDVLSEKIDDWPFLTVHFWGEKAAGRWVLVVANKGQKSASHPGVLIEWQLILHGTKENPDHLAFSGGNFSPLQPTFSQLSGLIFSGSVPHRVVDPFNQSTIEKGSSKKGIEDQAQKDHISSVCHSECLGGCRRGGPQNCIACKHFSLQGECLSNCPKGTFGSDDKECLPCHGSCSQCIGPRQNQCTLCPSQSLMVGHMGICVETCPNGFFAENGSCHSCGNQCSRCHPADWCLSCDHHLLLMNGSCHIVCPSGTFESPIYTCEPCDASCKTCIGGRNTECASCNKPLFMSRGRCLHRCPRGTYGDPNSGFCRPCPVGCSSCNGEMCTSCEDGWRLKSSVCVALRPRQCAINKFLSGNNCRSCHSSCFNCVGPSDSECLHCIAPSVLLNAQCLSSCPDGYFAHNSRCLPCPFGCDSCESFTLCTSCSVKFHFFRNQCLPSCPTGFYSDRGRCVACDNSCASCWGPGSNQCFSCAEEALLLHGTCKTRCPDGHFKANSTCLPCYHNCRTCNGAGLHSCTSCDGFLTLDGGMCLECSAGRYYNSSLRSCVACDSSCLTCNGKGRNNCTSCQAPLSLHPATRSCRFCCPLGTKEDSSHCCLCNPETRKCVGSDTTDKRRIALSLHSQGAQASRSFLSSTSALVLLVCIANAIIFGAVFAFLQQVRSGRRRLGNTSYGYRRLPLQTSWSASALLVPAASVKTGSDIDDSEEDEEEADRLHLFART